MYNEWSDGGFMDLVPSYNAPTLSSIANSTFVPVFTPESLMSAVTVMTGLVSEVVANSDFSKETERLTLLGMTDAVDKLADIGLNPTKTEDQQECSTAVSSLLVSEFAGRLQTGNGNAPLSGLLFVYSSALAYGEAKLQVGMSETERETFQSGTVAVYVGKDGMPIYAD